MSLIADSIARIKNRYMRQHKDVELKYSSKIVNILKCLKTDGYIYDYKVDSKDNLPIIIVNLKYHHKKSAIQEIKIVSKPGCRIYRNVDQLEKIKGYETYVVSTPKGVMNHRDAIKNNVGGEVFCKVF